MRPKPVIPLLTVLLVGTALAFAAAASWPGREPPAAVAPISVEGPSTETGARSGTRERRRSKPKARPRRAAPPTAPPRHFEPPSPPPELSRPAPGPRSAAPATAAPPSREADDDDDDADDIDETGKADDRD